MRWFLLIAAAGCAKVEEPPAFEEPTIVVEQFDNFETTVTSRGTPGIPGFRLHFTGGENGIHYPDTLQVGSRQVLATTPNCNHESQIGVAMFPLATAAAAPSGGTPTVNTDSLTTNFVQIDVGGPHLARIVVGFSLDYTCNGSQQVSGRSTFTILPTGRIVRNDQMIRPATSLLDTISKCGGCTGGDIDNDNKIFTTYWSFRDHVANTIRDAVTDLPENGNPVGAPGTCTVFADTAIGVQFDTETSRFRNVDDPVVGRLSAHVFDFHNNPMALAAGVREKVSAIQIEPLNPSGSHGERCGALLDRLVTPGLVIGGQGASLSDGIYFDNQGIRREPFTIEPGSGSTIPPGFVATFQLERGNATITRNPAGTIEPVGYVMRDFPGSDRFFVVFNEGLADGDSILIEPQ